MVSALEKIRLNYLPSIAGPLKNLKNQSLRPQPSKTHLSQSIEKLFPLSKELPAYRVEKGKGQNHRPLRVGVFFSGGQAAGGHNVLSGLYDGLLQIHSESALIGFLGGPSGLIENRNRILTQSMINSVRNLGGFDLIGSGRTKIETAEQFAASARHVQANHLDVLVVIGGDDSNTNAAHLTEYFLQNKISTTVIGVPKTIDGDLRSDNIEISFGFDSATKTYSELIGNIERDCLSAKKYYHFIKLMGRSASHIALECSLKTHPNLALIGEERKSLNAIVQDIVSLIIEREKEGKEYGVILLPEGLLEFVPEFHDLIAVLNQQPASADLLKIVGQLSKPLQSFFLTLPEKIQKQLLSERDPHGNVQFSQIETEQLILELVKKELKKQNIKINALSHFFGYEGRSCFPTNFDANYCYSLGLFGAIAARDQANGVILAIKNLHRSPEEWEPIAEPIVNLLVMELRAGLEKPVIAKTLVDVKGKVFLRLAKERTGWRVNDHYQTPGPIQFFGDSALTNSIPVSLMPG